MRISSTAPTESSARPAAGGALARGLPSILLIVALLAPTDGEARRGRRPRPPAATGPAAEAFAEGTRRFKARDYLGAIESYQRAYELAPHHVVQCNIARCHERTNDMIRAARHFARCLTEGGHQTRAGRKISQSLARVRARISEVEVRSPGKGGLIYLDGELVGPAPRRFSVNPGRRIIEVRREGASPASSTITTRGGEQRTLELVPIERYRPGPTPRVVGRRGRRLGPDAAVARSTAVEPRPAPPRAGRRAISQAWFWSCAAVTVGLAAAASVVGVQALNLKSDYEENPTRAGYNSAKDRRLLANLLWGGTLLAGAGTTLLFVFTDFRGGRDVDGGERAALTSLGVGVWGVW